MFRYVKSRSDLQLLHGLGYNDTSSCKPLESSHNLPIVPCGLMAWSLFNDTYTFSRGPSELKVNRKNIAWKSDRDHKFGNHVYPFNFQNGTLIGGGKLDPSIPVSLKLLNCISSLSYCHPFFLWSISLFGFEISFIGKNQVLHWLENKAKIEYISGGQPSPHELAFGVELDLNPHFKMVSESIPDPLIGHPPYYPHTKPKSSGCKGVYWEKLSPSLARE